MLNAPVGFRFNPAEEELVGYYFANRVAGNMQGLWPGLINEFDMYTEEPWDLWQRFYRPNLAGNNLVEAKSDNYIYLFTTLKKVASSGNGKRVNRRVEKTGGTWHGQNTKFFQREGGFSCCERHFLYKNDKSKEQDGAWLMKEFCFHEDDGLVLCRIGKKPLRGRDDREDHHLHASVSTRGRSPGTGEKFHASSAVVYDVNDDNFTVQGTKAKRTRTEGMFSGSVSLGPPYQNGIGHDQGGKSLLNSTGIDEAGAMNTGTPYHHGMDQNQDGDGTIFDPIRIDEDGTMNIGIHHGTGFGPSNQGVDGSFTITCMDGENDKPALSGPVLVESGLLELTTIQVRGGVHEKTCCNGMIGELDQEDRIDMVGMENNQIGVKNHKEVKDGSMNATMDPNTEIHEEVEADMDSYHLDDLKELGGLPDLFLGPDAIDLSTWNSLPNLDDVDVGDDEDPMTFILAELGDQLKY